MMRNGSGGGGRKEGSVSSLLHRFQKLSNSERSQIRPHQRLVCD